MTYVLIIMLAGSGSAVGSAEFIGREACENAANAVAEKRKAYSYSASALTVCVPKKVD